MIRSIVGTSLMFLASGAAFAQTAEPPLSFDAASLKPTESPSTANQVMRRMSGGPGSADPGMFRYTNVTLKLLVEMAYNLKEYQVEGPNWIDLEGYDLTAKMPPGTTKEQAARMMQTLLAERFHLAFHRDNKQMPVYVLTVGKGGPKMKEVEVPPPSANAPVPPPGPTGGRGPNGPGVRMMMSPDGMRATGSMTMTQLTDLLTRVLARPVLDQTELKATYDVDISFMPEDMGGRMGPGPTIGGGAGEPGGDSARKAAEPAPTLAQALQDKLGLKLETRRTAAEILIIDRADKVPVEN